jgi:hypothetical protein
MIDGMIDDTYSLSKIESNSGKLRPRSKSVPCDMSVTPSGEFIARAINMYLYVSGVSWTNLLSKSLVAIKYRFNDVKKNIAIMLHDFILVLFILSTIREI